MIESMASFAPAKSKPLHNFELPPLLKWSKDGKSSGGHTRRRSMKSPPQRLGAASGSPARCSPLRDYVTASPSRSRSPSPEYPVAGGDSMKQAAVCEGMKRLAVSGESETLSLLRQEAVRSFGGGDWPSESEVRRKGKGTLIQHDRNRVKKPAFYSSNSEEGKLEKKSKASESVTAGIKKCNSSIKIGSRSSNQEEKNPRDMPAKIEEREGIDEGGKEGKTNTKSDEDIRLWNLRPRNVRSKFENAKFGGESSGKSKSQPQLRSGASKSGGKEGKGGGGGGEKKEKCERHEDNKERGEKKEKKKLSISISLTKEEIEEDIFALTGSKPSRRPKKRPKNVQKQLDVSKHFLNFNWFEFEFLVSCDPRLTLLNCSYHFLGCGWCL